MAVCWVQGVIPAFICVFMIGALMAKRFKLSRGKSKRNFTRGAVHVHPKNNRPLVMRGGIRL